MREFRPYDGHPIRALSFDPSGTNFLCVTTNQSAKIMTRDGQKVSVTIKGDMYISDTANTKGHTANLTDGMWHPLERQYFITSSLDGTVRYWDIDSKLVGVD